MFFSPKRGRDGRVSRSARRRAAHSFLAKVESLETRQLLAAGPLGLDLDSIEYVDAMKTAGEWGDVSGESSFTLGADGWPTSDAGLGIIDDRVNEPWNGPDPNAVAPNIGGTYSLSFQGEAGIETISGQSVQNQVYNPTTNITTAQIVVPQNSLAYLSLSFLNTINPASVTGKGVADVKLIKPGYAANTTQIFTTEYLDALEPFTTLRYLNIDDVNNYTPTFDSTGQTLEPLQWSQRRLPSQASQTNSNGAPGQAWEYMIALANATNTDMWINIPGQASDDYVTQLANLIKYGDTVEGVTYAGLNPNLKVYVEYSNEVWGGINNPLQINLDESSEAVAAGDTALDNDGSTSTSVWADRYYLQRSMQITNDFRSVFGADPTYATIRPVLAWQEQDWQYYADNLPWFQSTYGDPANFFYGMGDANYISPTDLSSVNNAIASLQAAETQAMTSTANIATIANYYGMQMVAYEGGPGIYTSNSSQYAVALATERDPRMEQIVETEYEDWYAAGGDLANFFDGPYSIWTVQYGLYDSAELSEASDPSLSPKYQGLVDITNAAPVAVTAGIPVSTTGSTSLPVATDSYGQQFAFPRTGNTDYWLLNVPTAGTYELSLASAASGTSLGQIRVSVDDVTGSSDTYVTEGATTNLGTFTLKAGLNTLEIYTIHGSNDPSNLNYLFNSTALTMTPSIQQVSESGTGFSEQGTWTQQGSALVAPTGNGTSTATWTFKVTPGVYEISANWPAGLGSSQDAPYTILDGTNLVATAQVNQSLAPVGSFDGTTTWQDLGGPYTVLGNTLTIKLANDLDGTVAAQSIRIQQLQSISSARVITDTYPTDFTSTGTSSHVGDRTMVVGSNGTVYPAGTTSSSGTFTFQVTPGVYMISSLWPGGTGFAPDATYTILDGSTVIATDPVNQYFGSTGYNDSSVNWQALGGPFTISTSTLTIRLNSALDGQVEAEAVRIQMLPTAMAMPKPTPASPTSGIIDNGGAGYATSGTWVTSTSTSSTPAYGGTVNIAGAGEGFSQAAWAFNNLAPGSYLVEATWTQNTSGATNAPYTIYDGTTIIGNALANQQYVPSGDSGAGYSWQKLGTFSVSSGYLQVILSNLANGPVIADAIRIIPVTSTQTSSTVAATYVGSDSTTQGTWSPTYGSAGYEVMGGATSLPSYATITTSSSAAYPWSGNTTDVRAPQIAPGSSTRIPAAWSGSTFTVDVNLTDGQAHNVSLYLLDWDKEGRSEQIQVINPATGVLLNTQLASSFQGGEYFTWSVTGHVQFKFTVLAGYNAVLSGIYIANATTQSGGSTTQSDGNTASFGSTDTTTQGTWSPTYGSAGYEVLGGTTSLPSYATITTSSSAAYPWSGNTTDVRAPQIAPGSSTRIPAAWSGSTFTVDVNLTDGQAHNVSLYLLDWDKEGRIEQIQVIDPTTGTVLSTQIASSFQGGEYLTWSVTGHVQFKFTVLAGYNAVLSGIYIANTSTQTSSNTASFGGTDTTTKGTWSPTYGSAGYEVMGGTTSLPSYATITTSSSAAFPWTGNTSDLRAPQIAPGSTTRIPAAWSGSTFTVDVNLTDGQAHNVSLYLLDWDQEGRSEQIQVINPTTGAVLSTQVASSFQGGEYLTWSVTGHVQFKFTMLAGYNAVLSGIFIANATTQSGGNTTQSDGNTASFGSTDSTTQGNWSPTYGKTGYEVLGGTTSLPSYATVTTSSPAPFLWSGNTTDVRALQTTPGSSTRIPAAWSGSTFTVDVNLTDGQVHNISLYLLDWDQEGRSEQIQVIDPTTGTVLSTQVASSFQGGKYYTWSVTGHVQFKFTVLAGYNAVLSGLFIN